MSQQGEEGRHWVERLLEVTRASPLSRLLAIGAFVLLLQIPIMMIYKLGGEREDTRRAAIAEVSDKWGRSQRVIGPLLIVPIRPPAMPAMLHWTPPGLESPEEPSHVTILPRELEIDAELRTETRYRGIFEVPVYRSSIEIRGRLERPDFDSLGVDPERLLWEQSELVLEIGDIRQIQNAVRLTSGETEVDFEPGTGRHTSGTSGIHVPVATALAESGLDFALRLDLNGSERLRFAPLGMQTSVRIRGGWPDPSFQGAWLPATRRVGPEGFDASWSIPHLGRGYPQQWLGDGDRHRIAASEFGVDLLSPIDAYRSTQRALKYQLLFLGLTFVTLWLFEVLVGVRLHPIQYGLIGAAICLFYVLELSLAEHVGLALAYGSAATAVVAVVGAYARAILASLGRAALVGGVLGALYMYLYLLLRIQSYALLVGSLGLFAILAVIMYATRHVDWYALRLQPK